MSGFVVDASATLAWLFAEDEQIRGLSARIETATIVAPWLWRLEVTNALLVKERRGQLSVADATRFLQVLDALEVDVVGEPTGRSLEGLAQFARPHQLTSYDAVYVELAITLALPLCTIDRNMEAAARALGVELVTA